MKLLFTTTILFFGILLTAQYNYGLEVEQRDAKIEGRLNLTFGDRNIYIGQNAGINKLPFSTFDNVAIGNQSGAKAIIPGSSYHGMVMIGSETGRFLEDGFENVFIGYRAAFNQESADGSVYVGVATGSDNKTGSRNTFIGGISGCKTLGSDNVFLGFGAGFNELGSNRLYIENSTSIEPLIFGNFAQNKAGINWNSSIPLPATFAVNGTASKTAAGDWLANSDARLKKNIEYLSSKSMLDKIRQMKAVSYEWNDNTTGYDRPIGKQYRFIAQDLQQVWPENVIEDTQGYLQTAYGTYDHMYVEAIKELDKDNKEIKEQYNQIIKENQELRKEIDAIKNILSRINYNQSLPLAEN